jgi:hypothetical protein
LDADRTQSAEFLKQGFALISGLSYVKAATLYQLRDMGSDPSNPEDNFGLLREDFTPRPAHSAFAAAMRTTAGTGSPTATTSSLGSHRSRTIRARRHRKHSRRSQPAARRIARIACSSPS